MNSIMRTAIVRTVVTTAILTIGGCAGMEGKERELPRHGKSNAPSARAGSLLGGEGGLQLLGGGDDQEQAPGGSGIGVNAYLWRATLDTLSFMPLKSADPFGGVIITEWYAPPEAGGERFKVTAYILGRALRADGVSVSVFRQVKQADGTWQDAETTEDTKTKLENAILARAREMRSAAAAS